MTIIVKTWSRIHCLLISKLCSNNPSLCTDGTNGNWDKVAVLSQSCEDRCLQVTSPGMIFALLRTIFSLLFPCFQGKQHPKEVYITHTQRYYTWPNSSPIRKKYIYNTLTAAHLMIDERSLKYMSFGPVKMKSRPYTDDGNRPSGWNSQCLTDLRCSLIFSVLEEGFLS